jgi:hypothetical protein
MRASCVVRHAWVFVLLLGGCTPTTTRPPFAPMPEALHAVVNARPAAVAQAAQEILKADTVPVHFVNLRDAYVESGEFAGTQRVRLWADPDVPGKSRVTIEAVYRPLEDPSRTRRDLERASPPGSAGQLRAAQLLAALKEKLGVTVY